LLGELGSGIDLFRCLAGDEVALAQCHPLRGGGDGRHRTILLHVLNLDLSDHLAGSGDGQELIRHQSVLLTERRLHRLAEDIRHLAFDGCGIGFRVQGENIGWRSLELVQGVRLLSRRIGVDSVRVASQVARSNCEGKPAQGQQGNESRRHQQGLRGHRHHRQFLSCQLGDLERNGSRQWLL
jgi:hypothetical protein